MGHLHVEQIGEKGYPLVMLHGWGQSVDSLKPLGELLSGSHVHLIDLPGFGQSELPDGVWNSFQYADRIIAYLDAESIKSVDVLGHSFGGKVALSLAYRYPERIRKLVLLNSAGLKRERSLWELIRFQTIRYLGKITKIVDKLTGTQLFKDKFVPRFGSLDYQRAGPMKSILVKSVNEDLTSEIAAIQSPTLILWGEHDNETPLETGYRFNKLIKNSELIVFPGKGHQVFQDVGAHLCASYIVPFLADERSP